MTTKEFNKLKKGCKVKHYRCEDGYSFYEYGTVLGRDRNPKFVKVQWFGQDARIGFAGRHLLEHDIPEFIEGVTHDVTK
jgi:hypothetical protein